MTKFNVKPTAAKPRAATNPASSAPSVVAPSGSCWNCPTSSSCTTTFVASCGAAASASAVTPDAELASHHSDGSVVTPPDSQRASASVW